MKDWHSSLAGILMIALAGLTIWREPAKAMDPVIQGQIVAGAGLIAAADSKKNPEPDVKKAEPSG